MGDVRRLSDDDGGAAQRAVRLSAALHWLFACGHAADLVLVVMLVEWGWLAGGRRWPAGAAALRLLPGALMMVALRGALTDADWRWIALPLALAFPAHLADLRHEPSRPPLSPRT